MRKGLGTMLTVLVMPKLLVGMFHHALMGVRFKHLLCYAYLCLVSGFHRSFHRGCFD